MNKEDQIMKNLLEIKSKVEATLTLLRGEPQAPAKIPEAPPEVFSLAEAGEWNRRNVRALLVNGFSPSELKSFCFDSPSFRDAYDRFGNDTGKAEVAQIMIEHGVRKQRLGTLLGWCMAQNPKAFGEYGPYRKED